MKVEHRQSGAERAVLTGMVVDRATLGAVAARWDSRGMFTARYANLVGGWCVEHYNKFRKAPGRAVEGYFDAWAATAKDKDTVALVESFVAGLSDEYGRNGSGPSPDYLIDLAGKHFNMARLRATKEQLEGMIEDGDVDKGWKLIHDSRPVEVGNGAGVKLLTDRTAVESAYAARGESLVRFGQEALDNFFSESLCRDGFIGFLGKEKIGKSYWLQELAWQAVRNKRNVAFFEVGDQSQHQIVRRFGSRAAMRPNKVDSHPVRYPTAIVTGCPPGVSYKELTFRKPLSHRNAHKALLNAGKRYGQDRLRLSVHPNSSINVHQIESVLDGWARDGWVVDACVVDYADILAPINGTAETRDQINATWKALRALSQKWHCLVVTATQSDADSYNRSTLSRDNFSEDKRKYAHVTGMCGINQTDTEKENGIYRLNWIVLRELEFSEKKCVHTAACLALANPAIKSCF